MAKEKESEILAPRANPHLFGHEAAEQRFLHEFQRGLLHHAYLITGPKGIGKATFAYRMARFILSHGALSAPVMAEEGPSLFGDPLPAAPAPQATHDMNMDPDSALFRRIAAGSHTDLLSLSPAFDSKKQTEKAQISADEARKVPGFLSLTPAEGAWRVVVVDAVDQLNTHAANALLKIMEEPPANALLLLVCHEPGGILPTIRSRCRHFALQSPDRTSFEHILQTVAPSIDLHDYGALYALSYGSAGLAITLTRHRALHWYQGWLAALQPGASEETKRAFADEAASAKSPESWAMLLHGWETLMHRISLYPHYDRAHSIVAREDAQLEAIADTTPFATRQRWLASARHLIHQTDTFNLDKRYTLRLMLEPTRLTEQFPAAA